jgi:hypothetical protein
MHDRPSEKDWKAFRKLAPILRERYLRGRIEELAAILADGDRSPTERFWDLEEQVGEIATALRACLDGHSRSRMRQFIIQMLAVGMMTCEDLDAFSEELRERMIEWTKPEP